MSKLIIKSLSVLPQAIEAVKPFEIEKDGIKIDKRLASFDRNYKKTFDEAHVLAVSCLVHAAQHGNPARLNRFFSSLNINDKLALKAFVLRINSETNEDGFLIPSKYDFLSFNSEKGFTVKKNHVEQAANFILLAEQKLINPDGKEWKRFYERSVIAEMKKFEAANVVSDIKALLNKAEGGSDKYVSNVPPAMIAVLTNALTSLERLATPANPAKAPVEAIIVKEPKAAAKPVAPRQPRRPRAVKAPEAAPVETATA